MSSKSNKAAETERGGGRDWCAEAAALRERVVGNRRAIHAHPERGLETPLTQALIVRELRRIGLGCVREGNSCTSVVCDIEGEAAMEGEAPTVLLRADIDALPLEEKGDVEWASKNPGVMHACGHDGHAAMLLGAAEILAAHKGELAGRVRLMFQPGEEGFGGAKRMIAEGVLDGVDTAFAIHLEPSRPLGELRTRVGTVLAGDSVFSVTFTGTGGHASMPYHARDPILAIGPFVDGLSHVAARETDPDDRAVFSVTCVQAGTTVNVIPSSAKCSGTIRTLSRHRREVAEKQLRRVAAGIAAAYGLEAEVKVGHGYPPTVNHEVPVRIALSAARTLGLETELMPSPIMGAEDFSYVLESVPGAMVFLGAQTEGGGPLHSDTMKLDEAALPLGVALHVAAAFELLRRGREHP